MGEEPSKLEKIAASVSSSVIAAETFLCYNNFDGLHPASNRTIRWLPIENSYFGDTPEIFTAIMASGLVGEKIRYVGEKHENKFLQFAGKHFPTLTATAIGTYYTLGESIMPYLLPGTADVKDIPAVVMTAVATPLIFNYAKKAWDSGLKNKVTKLIDEVNTSERNYLAND